MRQKWINRFIKNAGQIADWSEDLSTKCGCILVNPRTYSIIASGYNGLPRDIAPTGERLQRPDKYVWTEHAERNAIYNAARDGVSLEGSVAFVTHTPCTDCARGFIQSGITMVYFNEANVMGSNNWEENFAVSREMLMEAGIQITGVQLT